MKKFKIEKQLKNELRKNSPSDFASVLEQCERDEGGRYEPNPVVAVAKAFDYKRFCALALAGILLLSLLVVGLWQAFVKSTPLKFQKGYFVLDVNPSVEVCYDEDGVVTSAKGLNDDGKALLVGMDLTAKRYDEAAEKIFSRCLALGYFSATREDNAVLATAVSEEGIKDEDMTSAVKTALSDSFSRKKIKGVVIDGVTDPLLQEKAEEYGIDAQKYGLILSYLALGGALEESEYANLTIRELYGKIEQKKAELKTEQTAQSEQVLAQFEERLHKTLTEQIAVLVETLGVYLSLDDETQEKLNGLGLAVETLKTAEKQWQRKQIIDGILTTLDELKQLQTDSVLATLIESAQMSITVVYQFFEKAFYQLLKVSSTPEQISAVRLKKFADYGEGVEEFDAQDWQRKHETEFKEGWFALKDSWQKDRQQDF